MLRANRPLAAKPLKLRENWNEIAVAIKQDG
jgi:hypothetical protein